ncbi:MAG: hypothetical protein ACKVQJ_03520 [Pyrinomonadaceae bacterium]
MEGRPTSCPPDLALVLDRIAALGPDTEKLERSLRDLQTEFERATEFKGLSGTSDERMNKFDAAESAYLDRLFEILPSVKPFYRTSNGFLSVLEDIESWSAEKDLLDQLIWGYSHQKASKDPGYYVMRGLLVAIGADGSIEIPQIDLINILVKKGGALLRRLRRCPICNVIYWAMRLDGRRNEGSTCRNKRCSNTFHQGKKRIRRAQTAKSEADSRLSKAISVFGQSNPLVALHRATAKEWETELLRLKGKYGYI